VPEGDTIARSARTLDVWLAGRTITGARSRTMKAPLERVVGAAVTAVEAKAKHLLIRFDNGHVLHTHMRMTGSWHVYRAGERWRKPGWQSAAVLEAGDRVAVCFNAPVVELMLEGREELEHPSLKSLGPDVLKPPLDLDEVRRRARSGGPEMPIGELLLDQRVVSGIGNIYRCESLFLERRNPWQPWSALEDHELDRIVLAASKLMQANVTPSAGVARDFGGGPSRPWVYGRTGKPCLRCRTPIAGARMGSQARQVYWCPSCQGPGPSEVRRPSERPPG
jgi:endonuclease-8